MGEEEVSQRTYDAVQLDKCPYFAAKVEQPEAETLDFSKGESVVKKEETKPEPKEQPKAPPKPIIHDATLLQMSMEKNIPVEDLEADEKRMFEAIAQHGFLPPSTQEMQFKKKVKDETQIMFDTFTWDENMMIAFVPLVISHIAWLYAEKVMKYCADHRISEVKKLGRAIKEVHTKYIDDLRKDLDMAHINNVEKQTMQFVQECKWDFQIFNLQVNSAIKKEYPDMMYQDMRTDAWCGVLIIEFLKRHNREMDKIIAQKMGSSNSITNPRMNALSGLLDAYLPDGFMLKDTKQIDLCLRVLANRIRQIDFQVVD